MRTTHIVPSAEETSQQTRSRSASFVKILFVIIRRESYRLGATPREAVRAARTWTTPSAREKCELSDFLSTPIAETCAYTGSMSSEESSSQKPLHAVSSAPTGACFSRCIAGGDHTRPTMRSASAVVAVFSRSGSASDRESHSARGAREHRDLFTHGSLVPRSFGSEKHHGSCTVAAAERTGGRPASSVLARGREALLPHPDQVRAWFPLVTSSNCRLRFCLALAATHAMSACKLVSLRAQSCECLCLTPALVLPCRHPQLVEALDRLLRLGPHRRATTDGHQRAWRHRQCSAAAARPRCYGTSGRGVV